MEVDSGQVSRGGAKDAEEARMGRRRVHVGVIHGGWRSPFRGIMRFGDEKEAGGKVSQDFGTGAAVAPVMGADEGAEQGIETIFSILVPRGLQKFLDGDGDGEVWEFPCQESLQQSLVSKEFVTASRHRRAFVLDDLIQVEPSDHRRVWIDFRGLPGCSEIPTRDESQFLQSRQDAGWTWA